VMESPKKNYITIQNFLKIIFLQKIFHVI